MDFDRFENHSMAPKSEINITHVMTMGDENRLRSANHSFFVVPGRESSAQEGDFQLVSENGTDAQKHEVRDEQGNLTKYRIGPPGKESDVTVTYADKSAVPAAIEHMEIKRPDGEVIAYQREIDPRDARAQASYSESRGGMKADVLFGGLCLDKDGRINLYFDFARRSKATSYNPATGEEEFH